MWNEWTSLTEESLFPKPNSVGFIIYLGLLSSVRIEPEFVLGVDLDPVLYLLPVSSFPYDFADVHMCAGTCAHTYTHTPFCWCLVSCNLAGQIEESWSHS